MNFSIRNAELKDLGAIVEIYNSTIDSGIVTADTEYVTVESKLEWFYAHQNNRPLWVAESGETIAGWLSFHSFYGRPAYDISAEIGIYISENFRGKQLGKILLKKAVEEAPSIGIENLIGFIFADNAISIHLFTQMEFKKWGHLPAVARFGNTYQDLVIVGRKV